MTIAYNRNVKSKCKRCSRTLLISKPANVEISLGCTLEAVTIHVICTGCNTPNDIRLRPAL